MSQPSPIPAHAQALDIIDRIQRIGFPTPVNIGEIVELVAQLQKLSPELEKAFDLVSLKLLEGTVHKIRDRLASEGDIPVKMYTTFNTQLVVFRENLIL